MNVNENSSIRVAILDLYNGVANQGMRCLRAIIQEYSLLKKITITCDEFDVRQKNEVPDMSYDIYISSGGPGSPLESEGSVWEAFYFRWLNDVEKWNNDTARQNKKFVFFICHSFQLACRHFNTGNLCKRKSTAFGVFPIHLLKEGKNEPVYQGMQNPFYAVDSRDFQVIEPDHKQLDKMGGAVLAIEKERPHVALERAVMAVRFNKYMTGTQFHPEADAVGMSLHLQTAERKKTVIENYGLDKWESMINQLNDPDKIMFTYSHVLPNFLAVAISKMQPALIQHL